MRRILASAAVILAAGAFLVLTLGSSNGASSPTYRIELDNAFGLVSGADFKVAGVIAGSINSIDLCKYDRAAHCTNPLNAVVTVSVSRKGFGNFYSNATCQSRPQSLIGEYFLDCDPGNANGSTVLPAGATIPVTNTQSTIPADLVQDIMRLPYRQRFAILVNELGAAVASRSADLQSALKRADPALAQTDNLLALLANDAQIIKQLNVNADSVITALAVNSKQVQNFIVRADKISVDSATQAPSITATWQKLPGFLEQLRPALAKLGAASDAQSVVFNNLNQAATNLTRFFHDLVPFSNESLPSLRSLGQASLTGKPAVQAAGPLVHHLNQFAQHAPELGQNLAIILHALDDRAKAVETDPRSPGGKGYTGLESLLEYVFYITGAINYYGPYGHLLGVDGFVDPLCSPYTTPQVLANNIASNGVQAVRRCYAYLGPNQPGVTTPDPSWTAKYKTPANPSQCVPDPGGYPQFAGYKTPGYYGIKTNVCTLAAQKSGPAADHSTSQRAKLKTSALLKAASTALNPATKRASGGPPIDLKKTLGQIISKVSGTVTSALGGGLTGATSAAQGAASGAGGLTTSETQQLLNYLLAP
jgi:ABC-type transporter Mla subunit MlaD